MLWGRGPGRPQLSPLLTGPAVLLPPSATEARNELQPHPGICLVPMSVWSSMFGPLYLSGPLCPVKAGHKQLPASNLTTGREKSSCCSDRKKDPSAFNLFYEKSGFWKVMAMMLLGDRFSSPLKKKERRRNMIYSRHLFSLKYNLRENLADLSFVQPLPIM